MNAPSLVCIQDNGFAARYICNKVQDCSGVNGALAAVSNRSVPPSLGACAASVPWGVGSMSPRSRTRSPMSTILCMAGHNQFGL